MRFASAAALLFATSCTLLDSAAPAFRPVGPVARIVVTVDGRDSLPPITDPVRVRAIVNFVDARASGWVIPWAGVPVPRVSAGFFRRATDRGAVHYFGAGRGFFEASSRPGDFASRPATDGEVAEFLRLIGAPENAATAH
jgi:hypothetical protein